MDASLARNVAKLRRCVPDIEALWLIQKLVISLTKKGRSFHSVPSTVLAISIPQAPRAGLNKGPIP